MRLLRIGPLLLAMAVALIAGPARAEDSALTIELSPGWDGAGVPGSWVPYVVELRNDQAGQTFTGTLVLHPKRPAGAPPNSSIATYGTTYEQPITIARGAGKRVTVYGEYVDPSSGGGGGYEADLVDRGGAIAARSAAAVINPGGMAVGLLSDSLQVAGQLKDVQLPSGVTGVVPLTPQTFPANPILLGGLSALVVDNFDTSSLSQAQGQSLLQYVGLGGALVLGGGAGWRRTLSQLPPELVPLRPQVSTAVSMEPLLDLLGRHSNLIAPSVAGQLAPGARVVLADSAGNPLIAEMSYGAGRIEQLTFDPADETVAGHAEEVRSTWTVVLSRLNPVNPNIPRKFGIGVVLAPLAGPLPQYMNGRGSLDAQLVNLLSDTSLNALPPLGLLGGLLVLYILIAGPLNYAVVRRLGKRELMWVTVPLIAVLFTGAAYSVGVALHGSEYFVNEIQVLRVTPGGAVDAAVYDAVFSPRRGDLSIQAPEGSLASTYVSGLPYQPGTVSNDSVTVGRTPVINLRDVPVWNPRNLKTESMAREQLSIETHLRLVSGRIVGTVTNHGHGAIRKLTLVTSDGRVAQLAVAIEPGLAADVDATLQSLAQNGPPRGMRCNQFGCQQGGPNLSQKDKSATVIEAATSSMLSAGGQVQALAGVVDPVPGVRVAGGVPSRSIVAVFVKPMRLESLDSLTPGWSSPRVVASNGSSANPVSVVDCEIPAGMQDRSLRLAVGTASNFGPPGLGPQRSQVEIFDWTKNSWTVVDLARPVLLTSGQRGTGVVRLRIQGTIYLQGLQISSE